MKHVIIALAVFLLASSCKKKGPEITCKVNGVCFVCPDEQAKANCHRDPSTSRCKYADPSHCQ
jgi:hypothetical protein